MCQKFPPFHVWMMVVMVHHGDEGRYGWIEDCKEEFDECADEAVVECWLLWWWWWWWRWWRWWRWLIPTCEAAKSKRLCSTLWEPTLARTWKSLSLLVYLYFGCLCVNKYKKAKQDNLLYYVWNVSKLSLLEIRLAGTMTSVFLILHLFSKTFFSRH